MTVVSKVLRSAAAISGRRGAGGNSGRVAAAAALARHQQAGHWTQLPPQAAQQQKLRLKSTLAATEAALKKGQPAAVGTFSGPTTLDSSKGPVKLSGPETRNFAVDSADFLNYGGTVMPPLQGNLNPEEVRSQIIEYFHKTYTLNEKLYETFNCAPAYFEKHEALRHPPIFYLGHTAAFYVNKLHLGKFILDRIDPLLEMQMAVGVDEMSWDDWDSNSYAWPSGAEARADPDHATAFLQRVFNLRYAVRQLVDRKMRDMPMEFPIKKDSFWYVIMMGIEHENIHLETSSVIHRQCKLDSIQNSGAFPRCDRGLFSKDSTSSAAQSAPSNRLIPVEKGTTRIGREWEGTSTYGWDNEFGRPKEVEVPAFAASEYLVSNKEFFDFMEAGGYSNSKYWTEEGWRWVTEMKPTQPRFWRQDEAGGYYLRTLTEEVAMPWDWPAEVNNLEAMAFCEYLSEKTGKSLRLPMEDEYLRMRDSVPEDLQTSAHGPQWSEVPGNVNMAHWASSCPVDTFKSPTGLYDVLGNVWQHNLTPMDVCPGFQTHPLYDDFTTPCVGDHHARIMGGSWISKGANGATRDSKYAFRRHFTQHAGFRYIETNRTPTTQTFPYERDRVLCNAFRFHFDQPETDLKVGNFHEKLAEACVATLKAEGVAPDQARVLEYGCGPGRSVLELARLGVDAAHGCDRTAKQFQRITQRLLDGPRRLRWVNYQEAEFLTTRELDLEELGDLGSDPEAIKFLQVPDFSVVDTTKFSDYDMLICAQPGVLGQNPTAVAGAFHKVLKPGGILAVGTQYEWAAQGGASGEESLASMLSTWFDPVAQPVDLTFAKADSERLFDCGTQHLTFWQRRAEPRQEAPASAQSSSASMSSEQLSTSRLLEFQYGPASESLPMYVQSCVDAAKALRVPLNRALEVGTGAGRGAVELSKSFSHVDAGDSSEVLVGLAQDLVTKGELSWELPLDGSGNLVQRTANKSELTPGSVNFARFDAQALPEELKGYDLVCAFDVLETLERPKDFLASTKERLNAGGLLVVSSTYNWSESVTKKDQWLGGFKYGDNDGPSSHQGLKEFLGALGFEEAMPPQDLWSRRDDFGNGRKSTQARSQMTFWQLQ